MQVAPALNLVPEEVWILIRVSRVGLRRVVDRKVRPQTTRRRAARADLTEWSIWWRCFSVVVGAPAGDSAGALLNATTIAIASADFRIGSSARRRLTCGIVAPTFDPAVSEQRARVIPPSAAGNRRGGMGGRRLPELPAECGDDEHDS